MLRAVGHGDLSTADGHHRGSAWGDEQALALELGFGLRTEVDMKTRPLSQLSPHALENGSGLRLRRKIANLMGVTGGVVQLFIWLARVEEDALHTIERSALVAFEHCLHDRAFACVVRQ